MDYKLFLDSDVILDVVLKRDDFYKESYQLFKMKEDEVVSLYTSTIVIMNVQYLSTREIGKSKAIEGIKYMLDFFEIADCSKAILLKAYHTKCRDVEDAVQYFAAINSGDITHYITRNTIDYRGIEENDLPVYTPSQFLKRF